MRKTMVIACAVVALLPGAVAAQKDKAPAPKMELLQPPAARTRANVKVDVTISDQTGSGPVERKLVSVITAEESWGKIRTQAAARMGDGSYQHVALNVDARPWLTVTGAIQLDLTVAYNPLGAAAKDTAQTRPTELNQSMTVVLQNGKPVVVSQAADPIMDRKIIVEVVAAILK